ncbi:unnamed protein product, partial [Brassica rapa subsp. trilocularis]
MSDLILTLGTGEDSWKQIYCPLINLSMSEEFKFIYIDFIRGRDRMINYKGKLGMITLEYDYNPWDWDPNNSNGRKC